MLTNVISILIRATPIHHRATRETPLDFRAPIRNIFMQGKMLPAALRHGINHTALPIPKAIRINSGAVCCFWRIPLCQKVRVNPEAERGVKIDGLLEVRAGVSEAKAGDGRHFLLTLFR
jgi:hypothetical protein